MRLFPEPLSTRSLPTKKGLSLDGSNVCITLQSDVVCAAYVQTHDDSATQCCVLKSGLEKMLANIKEFINFE